MHERPYAIGACFQCKINIGIGCFVTWGAVSHDQEGGIIVSSIQEVVSVSSARGECDASTRPNSLAPGISDEHEFAFDDVNEFVLLCVRVPGRRLTARLDAYEIHAVVF